MDLLRELNEAQKKAVLHGKGPLLILAGAGAGKTRAIAHRIAYLVSQGVEPEKILAITFTNKAAEEMKERINALVRVTRDASRGPFVSTFHSLCAHILRKSGRPISVLKNFTILDKDDSLSLIKDAIKDSDIDSKQFQPGKVQSIISRYKGELITAEEFSAMAGNEFFPRAISKIWNAYEGLLAKQRALDFDDLILKTYLLFAKDKEIKNHYQDLWQYILIDEYQDTNKSQYELSKLLAEKHKNICIIGDMDQAIYSWRGADFRNIINFERDFPERTSIVFEENYRSTQNILEAAAKVIEINKMRKPKKNISRRDKGAEISFFEAMNEEEEAEFVAHKIKSALKEKTNPAEISVLYRANFQSRVLEEACLKHGIPYKVLGIQFYQRKEIKDIFSFIRASLNPDNLLDMKRIVNVPPRGIGKVTLLNYFAKKDPENKSREKMQDFLRLLESIKSKIESSKASEALKFIMQASGYKSFLEQGTEEDKERLENIKELVSIAARYDDFKPPEGIEKLITDAVLMAEQDNLSRKENSVHLMTIHASKGLEFANVFVVGLEEGLFPHSGFGDNTKDREEEERRLFYVAITRAKDKVFLSYCVSRTIFGAKQLNMPSQFLSDIPEHLLRIEEKDFESEKIIEYL